MEHCKNCAPYEFTQLLFPDLRNLFLLCSVSIENQKTNRCVSLPCTWKISVLDKIRIISLAVKIWEFSIKLSSNLGIFHFLKFFYVLNLLRYYAKNIELKDVKTYDEVSNKNYAYSLLQFMESNLIAHMKIYNKTCLIGPQNPLKAASLSSSVVCLLAFAAWKEETISVSSNQQPLKTPTLQYFS